MTTMTASRAANHADGLRASVAELGASGTTPLVIVTGDDATLGSTTATGAAACWICGMVLAASFVSVGCVALGAGGRLAAGTVTAGSSASRIAGSGAGAVAAGRLAVADVMIGIVIERPSAM